jgi:hypothetical protein
MDAYTETSAPGGNDLAHLPLGHIQREARAPVCRLLLECLPPNWLAMLAHRMRRGDMVKALEDRVRGIDLGPDDPRRDHFGPWKEMLYLMKATRARAAQQGYTDEISPCPSCRAARNS